jgi:hypothetical protein
MSYYNIKVFVSEFVNNNNEKLHLICVIGFILLLMDDVTMAFRCDDLHFCE